MSIDKSNGFIRNRNRDLPACSKVPQPTTLPRAPTRHILTRKYCIAPLKVLILIFSESELIYRFRSAILEAGGFRHDPLLGERGEQEDPTSNCEGDGSILLGHGNIRLELPGRY
jgi:hypothetical protein